MKKYRIQKSPFVVPTTDGKHIEEHFGLATDGNPQLSIAHMIAPSGWSEPFQTPTFDEYTYIIKGKKQFNVVDGEIIILEAGQSIKIDKNTRVQYSKGLSRINLYIWTCSFALFLRCKNIKKRCCSQLLRLAKEQNYYAHPVNFIS